MKNTVVQKELFKEFEGPKKKKKTPHAIVPRNYTLISVSYEQAIFITIAVIMLMVLLFSLGVERGKHLATSEAKVQEKEPAPIEIVHTSTTEEKAASEETEIAKAVEPPVQEVVEKQVEEKKDASLRPVNLKLFTIQVIAYRSKKLAQKELENLGKKGFDPFIIVGGGYYQICVGKYENKDKAKEVLAGLKKDYRDSFIRKR